jgi:hypothetical protein
MTPNDRCYCCCYDYSSNDVELHLEVDVDVQVDDVDCRWLAGGYCYFDLD